MGKILIISEKPKVTKELMKSSRFRGSKKVEGSKPYYGYMENDRFINTWAIGHLLELFHPHDYDPQYQKFDFDHLPLVFDPKYKVIEKTKEQFEIIRILMQRNEIESIINATDDDREGELIFREIYETIGSTKPVYRLCLSSYEPDELEAALNGLIDGKDYDLLAHSAKARQYLDHLVGDTITRASTVKFAGNQFLLSGGRVQLCLLHEIHKREQEVENFVPQNFYLLHLDVGFLAKQPQEYALSNPQPVEQLGTTLKGEHVKVISYEDKKTTKRPKHLYNLTDLYKDIIKEFKMPSPKAKKIIQKLYDDGFITYPRSDSRHLNTSMIEKVHQVLESHTKGKYGDLIQGIDLSNVNKQHRSFNDELVGSHFAIIPTKSVLPENRSEDEKKIYDLIMKRFIANWMKPAVYHVREVVLQDKQENVFAAKEKVLLDPGFLSVFQDEPEEDETKSLTIPECKEGDPFLVNDYNVHTGKSTKPSYHTESSILTFMETAGRNIDDEHLRELMKGKRIGTVATEESFIPKLVERGYVELKGTYLHTTLLGSSFIQSFPVEEIKDPAYTAEMEFKIHQIQSNEMTLAEFIKLSNEFAHSIVEKYSQIDAANVIIAARNEDIEVCKCTCGKQIVDKGKFYGCTGYPECDVAIPKAIKSKAIPKGQIEKLLHEGSTDLIKGFKSEEKTFDAFIIRSEKGLRFRFPTAEDLSIGDCPKCKKGKILDKGNFYGCSEFKDHDCDFKLPVKIQDVKISLPQIRKLLKHGSTDFINGFTSKEGKDFSAAIVLQDDFSLKFQFPTKDDRTIGQCPICKKRVLVGKAYYLCEEYKKTCEFILPGTFLQKNITSSQVKKLLEHNLTDAIDGFISPKTGNKFKAKLSYDRKEKRLQLIFDKKKSKVKR